MVQQARPGESGAVAFVCSLSDLWTESVGISELPISMLYLLFSVFNVFGWEGGLEELVNIPTEKKQKKSFQ